MSGPVRTVRNERKNLMMLKSYPGKGYYRALILFATALLVPALAFAKLPSDAEIDREIKNPNNRAIIEAFLRYELDLVNESAVKPLLQQHPSLVFFINQVDRGPLKNLFFLEDQVHKLREAQKNIGSLPYSILFSSEEKKKILSLKPTADRIVSFGIPLMKRDFYRVIQAARELADKKNKHPVELMPNREFRDAIYRRCEPRREDLDREMGELSYGESICMRLGWVLEGVTVTKLWLVFNDNKLPRPADYEAFRKKRSEYWQKRLAEIYKTSSEESSRAAKGASKEKNRKR